MITTKKVASSVNSNNSRMYRTIISKIAALCYAFHDKKMRNAKLSMENRVSLYNRNNDKTTHSSQFDLEPRNNSDVIDLVFKSDERNKKRVHLVRLNLEGIRRDHLLQLFHDRGVDVDKRIVHGSRYFIVASNVAQQVAKLLKIDFDVNSNEKPFLHSLKIKSDDFSSNESEITVAQTRLAVNFSARIYDSLDATTFNARRFFKYIAYLVNKGAEFKVSPKNDRSTYESLHPSDIAILESLTDCTNLCSFRKSLIHVLQRSNERRWRYEVVDFLLNSSGGGGAIIDVDESFYEALYSYDVEIVKCLIANGAKIESVNLKSQRMNSLRFAIVCLKGHWRYEIVKLLLEQGSVVDDRRDTSLFFDALRSHDASVVECFVERGADVTLKNESGVSPLHCLLISYQLNPDQAQMIFPLIRLLIKHGADIDENLSARDNLYITPLSEAVYCGLPKLVRFLLSSGANPNASDGNAALIFEAIRSRDIEIVESFLDYGARVDFTDPLVQTTPLLFALIVEADEEYRHQVVELLLDKGASIDEMDPHTGMSLVQIALTLDDLRLFHRLIERGAPVDSRDDRRRSSLFIAVEYNCSYDAAKTLIELGGSDVNDSITLEYEGESRVISVIAVAAREGRDDIVRLLLRNGARADDDTALQFASLSGSVRVIELLMDNGARFDLDGENAEICLGFALEMSRVETLKYLLRKGYNVFFKSDCLMSVFEKLHDLYDPRDDDSAAAFAIFVKYLAIEVLDCSSIEVYNRVLESLAWIECSGDDCTLELAKMKVLKVLDVCNVSYYDVLTNCNDDSVVENVRREINSNDVYGCEFKQVFKHYSEEIKDKLCRNNLVIDYHAN